jgi:hypothetical protein
LAPCENRRPWAFDSTTCSGHASGTIPVDGSGQAPRRAHPYAAADRFRGGADTAAKVPRELVGM